MTDPLPLASCPTPSPDGRPCQDVIVVVGTTPLWLPFVILAVVAAVVAVVLLAARPRHR
ncbi:hypothetical protein [Leifsonia sp. fls2-241-R2A-40a]|uniref:hypothetical protein n=1 Tax=Leifsonia sp. fls2-241-R2A-40a TaxID=3040290 RepID=UPI00254CF0F3|nr:hypothetical protein [Leifsonia sp. fls2-241-R2A-40a]